MTMTPQAKGQAENNGRTPSRLHRAFAAWRSPKVLTKLIGIGILGALLWQTDWPELTTVLRRVEPVSLAAAMVAMVASVSIKAFRWQAILRGMNVRLTARESLLSYYSAFFLGLITPGRLGEIAKMFYVQRHHNASLTNATISVMLDRIQDILALLIACTVTAVMFRGQLTPAPAVFVGTPALLVVLVLVLPGLMVRPLLGLWHGVSSRLARQSSASMTTPSAAELIQTIRNACHPLSYLATALSYAGFFGVGYFLLQTLDIAVPLGFVIFAITASSLLSLVPITISGLGTREVTLVTLFGMFGVVEEASLAFSLLLFFVAYVQFILWGFVSWQFHPLPLMPATNKEGMQVHNPKSA